MEQARNFAAAALSLLMELTNVLGLLQDNDDEGVDAEIQALVDERQQARKKRILQELTKSETFSRKRELH